MIRKLYTSDIPNLLEFFFADRNIQQDQRFDFEANDFEKMMEHSHITQLIWEEDNQIVGYLAGYNMGVWGYIDVLIVKASFRNKGIAKKLITHFVHGHDWTRLETSCHASDEDSMQFARRNGFNIEQTLKWFGMEL